MIPLPTGWPNPPTLSRAATEVADALVAVTELFREDDVDRAIDAMLHQLADAAPLAPLAGHALKLLTAHGELDDLLDSVLHGLSSYVEEHHDELRHRLGKRSSRWVPSVVDHKLFDRVLVGASSVLGQMAAERDHDLRKQLTAELERLTVALETSPEIAGAR